jgi:hypothetical protein
VITDNTNQFYRNVEASEFQFTNYGKLRSPTGKFRLIEHTTDMELFGVSFVNSGLE